MRYRGFEMSGAVLCFQGVQLCHLDFTTLSATQRMQLEDLIEQIEGANDVSEIDAVRDAEKQVAESVVSSLADVIKAANEITDNLKSGYVK